MKILVKNARVVDPANNIDGQRDILIENGKISQISASIKTNGAQIIEAKDRIVLPGLVDMHVHLREPGREDKETIATATGAAAKGGVTSVLSMPNTDPCIDTEGHIEILKGIIREDAKINVFICGAITQGRLGLSLSDIAQLKKGGAVAISDDGYSVDDEGLMRQAFVAAGKNNLAVICHCEDRSLSAHGVINSGYMSTILGLRGICKESEYLRVQRDIGLAAAAGCPVHIAHVSCSESVEIIAEAKNKGIKVTAETAPHYFSLDESVLLSYDTNMKMNPPLRASEDVQAIRKGVHSGIIDVIASDHAPHTDSEKDIEFERAEFGVIGLETILAVSIAELLTQGIVDWRMLAERLSLRPARILGIDKGTLGVGKDADLIVVCPDKEWVVDKKNLLSKSKNSAFLGRRLKGVVEHTICGGKIVFQKADS